MQAVWPWRNGFVATGRRLGGRCKSGWLQLLGLIPVIGWLILIYWGAQPGQPESNQYGPPPQPVPASPLIVDNTP